MSSSFIALIPVSSRPHRFQYLWESSLMKSSTKKWDRSQFLTWSNLRSSHFVPFLGGSGSFVIISLDSQRQLIKHGFAIFAVILQQLVLDVNPVYLIKLLRLLLQPLFGLSLKVLEVFDQRFCPRYLLVLGAIYEKLHEYLIPRLWFSALTSALCDLLYLGFLSDNLSRFFGLPECLQWGWLSNIKNWSRLRLI